MSYVPVDSQFDHEIHTDYNIDSKSLGMLTNSADPEVSPISDSQKKSRWTIGWKTPVTIVVLYLLGTEIMAFPRSRSTDH
jgi:hypothetical protein